MESEMNKHEIVAQSPTDLMPETQQQVMDLAEFYWKAGVNPYGLDTPQKLAIAIVHGHEVGMPPAAAIQSIAVINNRPAIFGDGLIGVVRASGRCAYVREWIEGKGEEMEAFCETLRVGEEVPVVRSFSVFDAQRAGLWQTAARVMKNGKNGKYEAANDSPWWRYPKRMLQMRARAWCLRDTYADVLKGIQSAEEMEDMGRMRDITPTDEAKPRLANGTRIDAHEDAQGLDLDHVADQTSFRPSDAGEVAPPSDPAEGEGDGARDASPPSPDEDPFIAPLEDQLQWLQSRVVMAWQGVAYQGDVDTFRTHASIVKDTHPQIVGLDPAFNAKWMKALEYMVRVVKGEEEPDTVKTIVANIAGLSEKQLTGDLHAQGE
jgi:hypothetical protein